MFFITRKLTGQVCGRGVSAESLDLYLAVLPPGVYAVENADGVELREAIVKRGRVVYREVAGV